MSFKFSFQSCILPKDKVNPGSCKTSGENLLTLVVNSIHPNRKLKPNSLYKALLITRDIRDGL